MSWRRSISRLPARFRSAFDLDDAGAVLWRRRAFSPAGIEQRRGGRVFRLWRDRADSAWERSVRLQRRGDAPLSAPDTTATGSTVPTDSAPALVAAAEHATTAESSGYASASADKGVAVTDLLLVTAVCWWREQPACSEPHG